jgi:hypothetical protein
LLIGFFPTWVVKKIQPFGLESGQSLIEWEKVWIFRWLGLQPGLGPNPDQFWSGFDVTEKDLNW